MDPYSEQRILRRLRRCDEFGKRRISLSNFSGFASVGRRLRMTSDQLERLAATLAHSRQYTPSETSWREPWR